MTSLSNTASQIRRDIVRMVHGCQSGHPGGNASFSLLRHCVCLAGVFARRGANAAGWVIPTCDAALCILR